jgi:hypothetical protein
LSKKTCLYVEKVSSREVCGGSGWIAGSRE